MFPAKDVTIMVKIQIVQAEEERHSLSQDLARIFTKTNPEYMDTMVECGPDSEIAVVSKTSEAKEEPHIELNKIHVNSLIIKARSPMLAVMLMPHADENNQVMHRLKFPCGKTGRCLHNMFSRNLLLRSI